MTNRELDKIDALEMQGLVIVNVMYENQEIVPIEMAETGFCKVEVVSVEEYEENGFETEGLAGRWIEF